MLELVDRKLHHFETGAYATVVCASIEPSYDTHDPRRGWASTTGHRGARATRRVCGSRRRSPDRSEPRGSASFDDDDPARAETVVAFYTDGLVERRGESLDVGLERLRKAITPGHPDLVARDIMRHLIGGIVPRDDIALVVMRRTGAPSKGGELPATPP